MLMKINIKYTNFSPAVSINQIRKDNLQYVYVIVILSIRKNEIWSFSWHSKVTARKITR